MYKPRLAAVAMLFLLLASVCCAQSVEEIMEDFSLQLQLPADSMPEDLNVTIYFVYGRLDSVEVTIFDGLKNSPSIRSYATFTQGNKTIVKNITVTKIFVRDNETSIAALADNTNMVVLVGSRTHNRLTEEAYSGGYIKNETMKYLGRLAVGEGKLDADTKVVVLRHNILGEGNRLENEAVKYSPLRGLIPDGAIPLAAASIGMLLMSFLPVIQTMVESKIADRKKKKVTISEEAKHVLGVKPREAAEILIAALVLGFALTWTFAGPSANFFDLLLLNAGVCLLAALSHDLTHRIMGKLMGIKMEYKLWYTGSFLTVFTAFLGNTFGLQGFLIEKVEKGTKEWKIGLMKLAAPLVSVMVAAAFVYMFSKNPQVVYQMIFTSASIIALAEITPVKSSDGEDIKRWNKYVFYAAFAIISATYTIVNFVI